MHVQKLFILVVTTFVLFLFGCQEQRSEPAEQNFQQLSHNKPDEKQVTNDEIANHLASLADSVPGVIRALAIVLGPYALVGIDVDQELDSSRVGTIKYSVTEALREDPYGKTAVVVADPDITARIQKMTEKVQEGYPAAGIIEEIATIIGRTMPIIPKEDRPVKENPKDPLDIEEEKELEDLQKEHSTEND